MRNHAPLSVKKLRGRINSILNKELKLNRISEKAYLILREELFHMAYYANGNKGDIEVFPNVYFSVESQKGRYNQYDFSESCDWKKNSFIFDSPAVKVNSSKSSLKEMIHNIIVGVHDEVIYKGGKPRFYRGLNFFKWDHLSV